MRKAQTMRPIITTDHLPVLAAAIAALEHHCWAGSTPRERFTAVETAQAVGLSWRDIAHHLGVSPATASHNHHVARYTAASA